MSAPEGQSNDSRVPWARAARASQLSRRVAWDQTLSRGPTGGGGSGENRGRRSGGVCDGSQSVATRGEAGGSPDCSGGSAPSGTGEHRCVERRSNDSGHADCLPSAISAEHARAVLSRSPPATTTGGDDPERHRLRSGSGLGDPRSRSIMAPRTLLGRLDGHAA